jgi:hypothetical protein
MLFSPISTDYVFEFQAMSGLHLLFEAAGLEKEAVVLPLSPAPTTTTTAHPAEMTPCAEHPLLPPLNTSATSGKPTAFRELLPPSPPKIEAARAPLEGGRVHVTTFQTIPREQYLPHKIEVSQWCVSDRYSDVFGRLFAHKPLVCGEKGGDTSPGSMRRIHRVGAPSPPHEPTPLITNYPQSLIHSNLCLPLRFLLHQSGPFRKQHCWLLWVQTSLPTCEASCRTIVGRWYGLVSNGRCVLQFRNRLVPVIKYNGHILDPPFFA